MRKALIFVYKKYQLVQALNLCDELSRDGKLPQILTKDSFAADSRQYPVKDFTFYEKSARLNFYSMREEAYGLFMSLPGEKISGDLSFRELAKYKDISLWDLSVDYITPRLQAILYEFNILEAVLNFERPSEVVIISEDSNLERLLVLVCKEKHIPVSICNKTNNRRPGINKAVLLIKRTKRFMKGLVYFSFNMIKSGRDKRYKIIFFPSVNRSLCSILPIIQKYDVNERLVINTFPCSSKKFKELGIPYREFWGYKWYAILDRNAHRLLKEIYDSARHSFFLNKVMYKGVSIGCMLEDMFEELVFDIFYHNIQKVDIVREILTRHKPEVVIVIHYSVDIALTAKSMSIPVVAMQSCSIYEFCFFGPLIHDAVIVDGDYWKQYLLKSQVIDAGKVHVAGPVKFDYPGLGNEDSRSLPRFKKIVIFAANNSYLNMDIIDHEKIRDLKAICAAMKNIKEAHLIIKAHPYERDLNLYKGIAREAGLSEYSIVQDAEMLGLISRSDLLITLNSTASYDAVLLDKNVISLCGVSDFEPEDMWDFRRYNAAVILDNLGDLEKCIRKTLFDPETMAILKKGRGLYISEHAHKLDKMASCRAKEAIDRFVEINP